MSDEAAVPAAVRLVRDFVNTFEPQIDQESLTTPDQLRDWFAERGLLPADGRLRPADLTAAMTIREGLREVLLRHAGHRVDPAVERGLNDALAAVPVRLVFTDHGHHLAPAGDAPLDHALAGLLDAIRQCAEDHTWTQLKVCARDTCRWAFFDASRNQARRWCSMAGCGNHVKMRRAYVARAGRRRPPPPDEPEQPR
ncbi:CGNR zinc finger domain-containing protein [Micromonospora sp. R77]|uniref:CGNR zinc finger domain-containing protein n=1 Tax=Micromonospora sp. R77 TaxID=2925836 RepID=UPI001F601410|nr:CGNR zinc finger domain-containing protein [Micromonospora sp. R77]MCI4065997.1 CGNR zinc finger domain-containing protein [Micromonospora sp. R77]